MLKDSANEDITFKEPLITGIIEKRKSQFTMIVRIGGEEVSCHCPTTGRIGNIDVSGRPCLLSKSVSSERKTPYTVEAISMDRPEIVNKKWIGINQNAINRYVEHYLCNGGFSDILGENNLVQREKTLGSSKIDFLVGETFLEVKMPLQHIQLEIPDHVKTKKVTSFGSTDRFVRHMVDLSNSLKDHQRAILLSCFMYDNPGFKVMEMSVHHEEVSSTVRSSEDAGVELWQANFEITPEMVRLRRHFKMRFDDIVYKPDKN